MSSELISGLPHAQERAAAVAWKDDGGDIKVAANLRWEFHVGGCQN